MNNVRCTTDQYFYWFRGSGKKLLIARIYIHLARTCLFSRGYLGVIFKNKTLFRALLLHKILFSFRSLAASWLHYNEKSNEASRLIRAAEFRAIGISVHLCWLQRRPLYRLSFLDAFATLWNVTVSYVMWVCLSVRTERLGSPLDGCSKNLIFQDYSKICRQNS